MSLPFVANGAAQAMSMPWFVICFLLNMVCFTGSSFVNYRFVFLEAGFDFFTVLTVIQLLLTYVGCAFCAYGLRLFRPRRPSIRQVLPFSCVFCSYLLFTSFSYMTNSPSTCEILKIFAIPTTVLIEWHWYGNRERWSTLVSLVPVCVGVGVTCYGELNVNFVGTFWGTCAIFANSLYTILGKRKQVELGLQPMELLMYQAPLSALMLLFVAVPLDGGDKLAAYTVTFTTVWTVLFSCIFAFGVKFSFFFFLRKTSPLTVNVAVYLRVSLLLLLRYIFVSPGMGSRKLLGVLLTLVGLAGYLFSKVMSPPPLHTTDTLYLRYVASDRHRDEVDERLGMV